MGSQYRALGERTIRVLVADNSHIHTHLLADALKRDPCLDVIPIESDSSDLVATAISHLIDVLVISSNLDEQPSRGFEILQDLGALHPKTRSVVLLDSSKDEAVLQAFRVGARGVFGKNEPLELLSKCVRCVHQDQIWARNQELRVAIGTLAKTPTVRAVNAKGMNVLSERELQVVRCLAEGLTNREVAGRLKLSPHTVKNYLFRIFDKLGVSSRVELLFMTLSQVSAEQGLLQVTPPKPDVSDGYSESESEFLEKAAIAGFPAAQLALAQLYLARRNDPEDLVHGYMWYLVGMECASQGRGFITKMMTPQQIEEAKHRASIWLSRLNRHHKPSTTASVRTYLRMEPRTGTS